MQPQVNAFHIPFADLSPLKSGSFVGSLKEGGPVNCFDIKFNPHGNGTHTECVGHISGEHHSVNQCFKDYFMMALVVSVEAGKMGAGSWEQGDLLIQPNELNAAIEKHKFEDCTAIVIRTLPNPESKRTQQHSGNNSTYFHPDCMDLITEAGFKHLLTDLPSVDREEDGGALLAHHLFWNYPENPRLSYTITELIYVPDHCVDGIYLLNLQVAAMESDASPSRPVIYGVI